MIGNDVWIGSNCVILAGVEIVEEAVLGAGSVAAKNVEAFDVVAGVPARVISTRDIIKSDY